MLLFSIFHTNTAGASFSKKVVRMVFMRNLPAASAMVIKQFQGVFFSGMILFAQLMKVEKHENRIALYNHIIRGIV